MNVIIRQAQAEDAEAILPLVQQFATPFVIEAAVWADSFHQILQTPHAYLIVAEGENDLLGYLLGFEHVTFYANGRVAWVEEIMVRAEYRRQGIGQLLMSTVETWATQRGAKLGRPCHPAGGAVLQSVGLRRVGDLFSPALVGPATCHRCSPVDHSD